MPAIPCANKIPINCPCFSDSPVANFSAEKPDVDVFIGNVFWDGTDDLSLNQSFGQLSCLGICESSVSQAAADDCARLAAELCALTTWRNPGGRFAPVFFNTAKVCTSQCPDGSIFGWTVAAGTLAAESQLLADSRAYALACQRAQKNRVCISTVTLPPNCVGSSYSGRVAATGGKPWLTTWQNFVFMPSQCITDGLNVGDSFPYQWSIIDGALPPGLTLHPCSGVIDGVPAAHGVFTFTIRATDAIGSFAQKPFTICIVEITTANPLPAATLGSAYLQNLFEAPGHQETEVWTLIGGALPPGITLTSAGVLSGTPTGNPATYQPVFQVSVDC